MKITHNKVGQNLNLKDVGAKRTEDVKSHSPSAGKLTSEPLKESGVQVSERAQLAAKAFELAKNAPDINREKVERLKEQIRNGTYQVDAEAVAEKLIKEHLEY